MNFPQLSRNVNRPNEKGPVANITIYITIYEENDYIQGTVLHEGLRSIFILARPLVEVSCSHHLRNIYDEYFANNDLNG